MLILYAQVSQACKVFCEWYKECKIVDELIYCGLKRVTTQVKVIMNVLKNNPILSVKNIKCNCQKRTFK